MLQIVSNPTEYPTCFRHWFSICWHVKRRNRSNDWTRMGVNGSVTMPKSFSLALWYQRNTCFVLKNHVTPLRHCTEFGLLFNFGRECHERNGTVILPHIIRLTHCLFDFLLRHLSSSYLSYFVSFFRRKIKSDFCIKVCQFVDADVGFFLPLKSNIVCNCHFCHFYLAAVMALSLHTKFRT